MRCPVLVSRTDELARLREALTLPADGRGGVVVVRGEPGVGKSRIAATLAEEAAAAGLVVLAGRAVRASTPVPLRPLGEALLAWLRTATVPEDPFLTPYLPALGRLAPQLGQAADDGPSSVVLIGEGLLRLASALGQGCVLLIEDLHWADPETLAVLEYVADNARAVPLLVVTTSRPHDVPAVSELVEILQARGVAEVVDVAPMGDEDLDAMLAACLAGEPPAAVSGLVRRLSAGFPLLVEELLADLQSSGALSQDETGWTLTAEPAAAVPRSFARSVAGRLEMVSSVAREVMEAASMLGTEFDWQIVGTALGLDARATSAAIRELRDQRLVVPAGDGFAIRHALTREAVLTTMLQPDRMRLASALAAAIGDRAGDADTSHQMLAELFEAAGDDRRAAERWLAAARDSIERGALVSAQEALARASAQADLASPVGLDVREAEVEVHALAGDVPLAVAKGEDLIRELAAEAADPERLGALRLRMARALIAGGRWDEAERMLAEAGDGDLALARVLAARIALGRHDADSAADQARAALDVVGDDRPEVACEAWEILGRAARGRDVVEAEEAFEEGYRIADRHDLALWRCRNLAQLAALDLVGRRPTDDRLLAARRAALDAGAIATAARVELDLNLQRIRYLELDQAMTAIDNAIALMERLRIPDLSSALLIRAMTHGLAGRSEEMETDLAAGLAVGGEEPLLLAAVPGHVRAPVALARGRYDEALDLYRDAMGWLRRYPGIPFSMRGLWALLETVLPSPDGGAAAREEVRTGPQATSPHNHFALRYADAVDLGRTGDADGAAQVFADAEWAFPGKEPWMELHARALVARAAAADGWGEPEKWFRHALDGLVDYGLTEAASAVRLAMREAGIAVPRKAAGSDRVPLHLQRLGVTAREYDVMELVAAGAANKDIAERLFLSVRTVETHVAKLLQRTGAADRGGLAAFLAE